MPMASRSAPLRLRILQFDTAVDGKFGALRGNAMADRVFYTASELGEFGLIWMMLAVARGLRSRNDWRATRRVIAGMAMESLLINGIVKSVFRRTRPPWQLEHPRRIRRPLTSSFPSGHATSAFTGAMLLSEDDSMWPIYFAIALVVASSRVYVKTHHASDVVAGIAIGTALGTIGRRLMPLVPPEKNGLLSA